MPQKSGLEILDKEVEPTRAEMRDCEWGALVRACTRHAISAPRVQWGDGHGVGNLQDSGSGPVTGRINVSDPRGGLEQSVQRFAPFRDTGV